MIPYQFDYQRAETLEEAFSLKQAGGEGAVFLAGGHSLVPALKLRLAEPKTVIDISHIEGLSGISREGETLVIGALTTHTEVSTSQLVREACPALGEAAALIGDAQVRNRGTIGGNVSHADPASDYPGILVALGATIVAISTSAEREVEAGDFFTGLFETALKEEEILTAVKVPVTGPGRGAAYAKFFNPASRYAVVGVGVWVEVKNGSCSDCRIGVTGAADHAFRASATEEALTGSDLSTEAIRSAAGKIAQGRELLNDLAGAADYRAQLCSVMGRQALTQAAQRAAS